jgi:hypothetical protein
MKINWEVDGRTWTIDRDVNEIKGSDKLEVVFDDNSCLMDKKDVAAMRREALAMETAERTPATDAILGITE